MNLVSTNLYHRTDFNRKYMGKLISSRESLFLSLLVAIIYCTLVDLLL